MHVLFVSSEIYPLAKTGGLADVSAALPRALAALGIDVRLVMPGYPHALLDVVDKTLRAELPGYGGQPLTRLFSARTPDSGLPVWLVDCPAVFNREGGLYLDGHGHEWRDNAERFALLSRVAAGIADGTLVPGWRADVVHANDWHTGLVPVFLRGATRPRPRTLFTIHNLAFQGLFSLSVASALGLPDDILTADGMEFFGRASFLKAGIRFCDRITTVSPTYAREILTPEHGCGLDGVLRARAGDLVGILNGVDYDVWDPAGGRNLPAAFDADDISGKHTCKAELQRELGLPVAPDVPLVIWNSRITQQKMADIVVEVLPTLLARNLQFAVLGEGDPELEARFRAMADAMPERMAARIAYEEPLAHRLNAGGDLLLHPSWFEPCGLSPLYALRYGTLPLVRAVGGLADTVVDAREETLHAGTANGFAFEEPTGQAMLDCVDRALGVYAQPIVWRRMQYRAMTQDFSWARSAQLYLDIYRELVPEAPLVAAELARAAPAEVAAASRAAAA